MAQNTVTNTMQVQILSVEDSTQNVLVNRSVAPFLDVILANGVYYNITPDAMAHSFDNTGAPFLNYKHFYCRNTAAAGSLLITGVSPLATGGVPPTGMGNLALLGPGDVFIYWMGSSGAQPVGTPTFPNQVQSLYNNLTYQGSGAGITFEWFGGL